MKNKIAQKGGLYATRADAKKAVKKRGVNAINTMGKAIIDRYNPTYRHLCPFMSLLLKAMDSFAVRSGLSFNKYGLSTYAICITIPGIIKRSVHPKRYTSLKKAAKTYRLPFEWASSTKKV